MRKTMTLPAILMTWGWLGVVAGASAQVPNENRPTAPRPVANQRAEAGATAPRDAPLSDRPEDERAIRAMADAFVRAYNSGNSKALAALYTVDAETIDEHGHLLKGRPMIEDAYSSIFQERPDATIRISIDSLRFLGPDVAKEDGRTYVKPHGNESESVRRYTVLYVKQGGQWLHSSVREEHDAGMAHHDRLKDLEWLLGEWLDQNSDSTVHVSCRWSDDKNFLLRDFTIHIQGRPVMTVSQRIGWDPLTKQFKSWVFDSEGGHGDALWARKGDQWVIKSTGVLPDGRIATATNFLTRVGANTARWQSTERTVGTESAGEPAEYVMVRKPPHPESR
jgi:uncharacterized protein (TIGR02246 family)